MKRIIYPIILLVISASVLFPQNYVSLINKDVSHKQIMGQNNIADSESGTTEKDTAAYDTIFPKIGFQIGGHSSNLNQNSFTPDKGLFFEAYLNYNLSDEVYAIAAFNYWKSKAGVIVNSLSSNSPEIIESKAFKLEVDFSLIKVYGVSLIIGPSILFENINKARSAVYTLGGSVKLNLPLYSDKVSFLTTVNYQTGAEAFQFGGGGFSYTFNNYLAGIEVGL